MNTPCASGAHWRGNCKCIGERGLRHRREDEALGVRRELDWYYDIYKDDSNNERRGMTLTEAWEVLDAAATIAESHGYQCDATLTRQELQVAMTRGRDQRLVVLATEKLDACTSIEERRALMATEVARSLQGSGALA